MTKSVIVCVMMMMMIITGFSGVLFSETDSKIKLHKGKVSISNPDSIGQVTIRGQAGAVASTTPALTEIVVLKAAGIFNVNPNGSFIAQVQAEGGDKIRIQARNESKKKSYGTFKVPADETKKPPSTNPTLLSAKSPELSLAIYINIVGLAE
jgi:hypothetical protein